MKDENELTGEQSLSIIQQMIDTAKHEQKDDGKGWILWGWMLFLSSVLTVLNMRLGWFQTFFFWNIFGLLTIILFIVEIVQVFVIKKKHNVKTYSKAILEKLNIGFFLSLMFVIVAMNVNAIHPVKGFAFLICLYGFWILIYGALLNFRPSIIGAFITWGFAYVALFQKDFEVVMLLQAGAVLCGYIIPGYIAKREFKKLHSSSFNQDSSV